MLYYLIFISCGSNKTPPEFKKLDSSINKGTKEIFPKLVSNQNELEAYGKVTKINSDWCVLVCFAQLEGVGLGRAIVYKSMNNSWSIYKSTYKSTERILLPEVEFNQDKIVITKKSSPTRIEVLNLSIK